MDQQDNTWVEMIRSGVLTERDLALLVYGGAVWSPILRQYIEERYPRVYRPRTEWSSRARESVHKPDDATINFRFLTPFIEVYLKERGTGDIVSLDWWPLVRAHCFSNEAKDPAWSLFKSYLFEPMNIAFDGLLLEDLIWSYRSNRDKPFREVPSERDWKHIRLLMCPDGRMTEELANKVWDILVEHGGANETEREQFVLDQTTRVIEEWRFCGDFGFGGKFWNERGRLEVRMSYSDDRTFELVAKMEKINDLLMGLAWERDKRPV